MAIEYAGDRKTVPKMLLLLFIAIASAVDDDHCSPGLRPCVEPYGYTSCVSADVHCNGSCPPSRCIEFDNYCVLPETVCNSTAGECVQGWEAEEADWGLNNGTACGACGSSKELMVCDGAPSCSDRPCGRVCARGRRLCEEEGKEVFQPVKSAIRRPASASAAGRPRRLTGG